MSNLQRKPTMRQKRAMELFLYYTDRLVKESTPPPTLGEILVEAGYKESIKSQPAKVTNAPAWKEFLNGIDDTRIVSKWQEWATDDDPKVRSSAIKAGENVMKLKDRYPTQKGQVAHIHGELKDIMEE